MRQCNYCSVESIKVRASEKKMTVTRRENNFYVHPPEVKVPDIIIADDAFSKKYFTIWVMELSTKCRC